LSGRGLKENIEPAGEYTRFIANKPTILFDSGSVEAMRKIPVFVSCPTELNPTQEAKRKIILDILDELLLEPRALGRSDFPVDFPLKEVYVIAKHCSGGVILGFEQVFIKSGIKKRGIASKEAIIKDISLPTPWNNLEAGILFGLKIPLLLFKEEKVEGGVFDYGITDVFVHSMPSDTPSRDKIDELRQVILAWHGEVSRKYYDY